MKFINKLTLFALFSLLLACSDNQQEQAQASSTGTDLASKDSGLPEYLVAVESGFVPFSYRNETGSIIGFDADILQAIGQDQGFNVRFIPTSKDVAFAALAEGQRDIVAGGLRVTSERKGKWAVSQHYYEAPTLIASISPYLRINQFSDIKYLKVGVEEGSIFATLVSGIGVSKENIVTLPTTFIAFKQLVQGKVQVVVGDSTVLRYLINQYQETDKPYREFEYDSFDEIDEYAFATNKDNTELLDKLNKGLENIRANGKYQAIYDKWFK